MGSLGRRILAFGPYGRLTLPGGVGTVCCAEAPQARTRAGGQKKKRPCQPTRSPFQIILEVLKVNAQGAMSAVTSFSASSGGDDERAEARRGAQTQSRWRRSRRRM